MKMNGKIHVRDLHTRDVCILPSRDCLLYTSTASVAGIDVESSASQGLTVEVVPPEGVEAGEYDLSLIHI